MQFFFFYKMASENGLEYANRDSSLSTLGLQGLQAIIIYTPISQIIHQRRTEEWIG